MILSYTLCFTFGFWATRASDYTFPENKVSRRFVWLSVANDCRSVPVASSLKTPKHEITKSSQKEKAAGGGG